MYTQIKVEDNFSSTQRNKLIILKVNKVRIYLLKLWKNMQKECNVNDKYKEI